VVKSTWRLISVFIHQEYAESLHLRLGSSKYSKCSNAWDMSVSGFEIGGGLDDANNPVIKVASS
jgi:hypothetical protein